MKKVIAVATISALALLTVGLLNAQVDTATILGTVQDATGAVVPGASVAVTATDTGIKTTSRTDPTGNYVVTPLRIGNYSVTVEATGFKTETHAGIVLQVQDRLRLDFTMQVGSVNETVNVEAEVPVIQTESTSLGSVVASQQITD